MIADDRIEWSDSAALRNALIDRRIVRSSRRVAGVGVDSLELDDGTVLALNGVLGRWQVMRIADSVAVPSGFIEWVCVRELMTYGDSWTEPVGYALMAEIDGVEDEVEIASVEAAYGLGLRSVGFDVVAGGAS